MRHGKPDANQAEIVRKLRALMVSVLVVNGDVDLIVGYRGRNYLFEVKNPRRPKSHDQRSLTQAKLRAGWQGQYDVVESVDDVLRVIGAKYLRRLLHNEIEEGGIMADDLTFDDFVGNAEREQIAWAVADARRQAFAEAAEIIDALLVEWERGRSISTPIPSFFDLAKQRLRAKGDQSLADDSHARDVARAEMDQE